MKIASFAKVTQINRIFSLTVGSSIDQSKCCNICNNESAALIILSCCHEKVCLSCNQKLLCCPYCRVTFSKITGGQPSGTSNFLQTKFDATGHGNAGSLVITYKFPLEQQEIEKCHVNLTLSPMVIEDKNLYKELINQQFKIFSIEPLVVENTINSRDFQDTVNKLIGTVIKYIQKNEQDCKPVSLHDVKIDKCELQKDLNLKRDDKAVQSKPGFSNYREKIIFPETSSIKLNTGPQSFPTASTSNHDKQPGQEEIKILAGSIFSAKANENMSKTPSTPSQDSDDSEPDAHYMSIKLDLYHAAKYYFKDSVFSKFFNFSVKNGSNVEFSIPTSYTEGEYFISKLKEFKMFEFDAEDKKEPIIRYVKENYSRIVAASHGHSLLTLMGLGDEFQQAKKKILEMIGHDEEPFWSSKKDEKKTHAESSNAANFHYTLDTVSINGELEYSLKIINVNLGVSHKHAFDFKPDLIITLGDPHVIFSEHSDYHSANLFILDMGEKIKNVQSLKLKRSSFVFQLVVDDVNQISLTEVFKNLTQAVNIIQKKVKSIVFTSNFLSKPTETHNKSELDPTVASLFAQHVCKFASEAARETSPLRAITLTTNKLAIPYITKVFQATNFRVSGFLLKP